MQIKWKSLRKTSLISYQSGNRVKRSGINLDKLIECLLAGDDPLHSLLSYESLVSVKENTDRKRKREERKENTDRTQTKLNAPHVQHNVKIIPQ